MAFEFVIIPSKKNYEDNANDVEAMMRHNINHSMVIEFDKNYDNSLNSRINKWKRKEYDIIIVDEEYEETNCIKVKFNDNDMKTETMTLLDFIDLVISFEENDEKNEHDEKHNDEKHNDEKHNDENQDGGCTLM